MILWNKRTLSEALSTIINFDFEATGVSIDSRNIKSGDLFIGIKGEHFDGSMFASQAITSGAVACLVSNNNTGSNSKIIQVADPTAALVQMAKYRRSNIPSDSNIIGVTGSAGKTTTKHILNLVLSGFDPTYSTYGNFNNHYGIPLSLVNAPPTAKNYVMEMGMNHAGEIEYLTKLVQPNIALITNIGHAHLEFFNSVADIARAKSEIYIGMQPGGLAIINHDDPYSNICIASAKERKLDILTFGEGHGADYQLLDHNIKGEETSIRFKYSGGILDYKVKCILGKHIAINSMAILAIVDALGYDLKEALKILSEFRALEGRGKVIKSNLGITILDDSYNANPDSVKASLSLLNSYKSTDRRLIAVLGDMKELGINAKELHKGLGISIEKNQIDLVCTVGELTQSLHESIPTQKLALHTKDSKEMAKLLPPILKFGDVILVKGSFSMDMAAIVRALQGS